MTEYLTKSKFPAPVNAEDIAQDWQLRGYSFSRFDDPPGQVWRDFVHPTNEVVTVAAGRLEVTIAGESIIAEVGDEVFIPRNAVHTVANASPDRTVWMFGYD